MNKLNAAFMLLISSTASTASTAPQSALEFNKWYLEKFQNTDEYTVGSKAIEKFVMADTLKILRKNDADTWAYEKKTGDMPDFAYDADYFTKTQDISEDWPSNITLVSELKDPICYNVYLAFGKDKKHILADCMVKDGNTWKVRSVTKISDDQ
ncbi:MAG TPA: hypothetical protein VGI71_13905 [Scandinavium sp.]|jgi:hypothetical protein